MRRGESTTALMARRVAAFLLVGAVLGTGIYFSVRYLVPLVRDEIERDSTDGPPARGCPVDRLSSTRSLGTVAYVRAGELHVLQLAGCTDRVVVASGAEGPVRFSPSGDWVAFGGGEVVSAAGGPVVEPLGRRAATWAWSPVADILAGVTPGGGVLTGGPERSPSEVLPEGSGVGSLAWSPSGRWLAIDRYERFIQLLDPKTSHQQVVYELRRGSDPPRVAGWAPGGRWILFFSQLFGSDALATDGLPLHAIRPDGGTPVRISDGVLPHDDFVNRCGTSLVLAEGTGRFVSVDKRITTAEPPLWGLADVSADGDRSWIWPSCSPDARWIAATSTPNREESRTGEDPREIWVLDAFGSKRARVVGGPDAANELPRWSSDGRHLLFVRRGLRAGAPGRLYLAAVDPVTGRARQVVGPVADLGPAEGSFGHFRWSDVSDWYRP